MTAARAQWGSRLGFILAAAGSAVGLGNIWRFPYVTGENGGGLFVLIYLVCIALVGIPILMSEIMIGRAAQRQPVAAFRTLAGRGSPWTGVGWMGVLAGFVILSYYVIVAGWAMDYTLKSVVNFTQPIHEQAEIEAAAYRATTDVDDVRRTLAERRARRAAAADVARVRGRSRPSVWRDHERYTGALAAAVAHAEAEVLAEALLARTGAPGAAPAFAGTDARRAAIERLEQDPALRRQVARAAGLDEAVARAWTAAEAAATARLLADTTQRAQIEEAQTRQAEIDRVLVDATVEAAAHYAALPEAAVLAEGETLTRRARTFTAVREAFAGLATDGWTSTFWATIFMLATIVIVAGGIAGGIERACKLLMPILLVLVLTLVVYGVFQPGFGAALRFVFEPDPTRLRPSGVLEALGQAFFTLSIGIGALITYGSYQRTKTGLAGQSVIIAVADTSMALLACMMIFPIMFTYDQEPAHGPGLIFVSMPLVFAEIGRGGMLLAILFFGLVVFAALTSSISVLEVVVSYFIDVRGWPRRRAAWVLGGCILAFGLPSAFATDPDFLMGGWETSFGQDFFTTMDGLATNWMLPLGGLLIALYAGWFMPRRLRDAEVADLPRVIFLGWLLLIRFVAPALVIVVLLQKVGILDADEVFHGLFG